MTELREGEALARITAAALTDADLAEHAPALRDFLLRETEAATDDVPGIPRLSSEETLDLYRRICIAEHERAADLTDALAASQEALRDAERRIETLEDNANFFETANAVLEEQNRRLVEALEDCKEWAHTIAPYNNGTHAGCGRVARRILDALSDLQQPSDHASWCALPKDHAGKCDERAPRSREAGGQEGEAQ